MCSKVQDKNYVVIQGWMLNVLKLKGNELIIYAIIYGFSQLENQLFSGSLQYLADWTNSTKQGVAKNLKSLIEKGYIKKNDKYINGVKFCEYYVSEFNSIQQSLIGGIQQSLTNNIDIDNIDNNILCSAEDRTEEKESKIIPQIIDYMNNCGVLENFKIKKTFKYNNKSNSNIKLIKARINEGNTLDDFKDVIYYCYHKFVENEFKGQNGKGSTQYYRPSTLFSSTNMENYKNQYKELIGG